MKISTEDCRLLIVQTIQNCEELITRNWEGEDGEILLRAAKNPKNWKRTRKAKPSEDFYFSLQHKKINSNDVEFVRDFYLKPAEFEEAVGFQVLQMKDGALVMGMDIGD